jgi:hypothetical protein
MTKQITIKLNEERFRPLLNKLRMFGGDGITESDSDLVGKCLFLCYELIYNKRGRDKTSFDVLAENAGQDKPQLILGFLSDYYRFKKKGLPNHQKK